METLFLFCFVFGALFTGGSALLGFAGSAFTHLPGGHISSGHELHAGHAGHGHIDAGHDLQPHGHSATGSHQLDVHAEHDLAHTEQTNGRFLSHVPLLNVSSALAFLTVFGATGFILMHFSGWPAILATPIAIVPGLAAGVLLALLLAKLLAGERVMRPIDYELEGTIGRITVSVPASGVGEVVFSKGGSRRSEAARSLGSKPIPYDTEVVIVEYEHGIALVQPYDEFIQSYERSLPTPERPASTTEA